MVVLILATVLVGLLAGPAQAQSSPMSLSLKGGVTLADLDYTEANAPESDQYMRFMGGITLGMSMSQKVGLDLDVLYVMKGAKNPLDGTFGFTEMETRLDYLILSPLLRFAPRPDGAGIYFMGGAEVGYLLKAEAIATKMGDTIAQDGKESLKEYDYGVSFGLGFESAPRGDSGFFLEARYALGLVDIGDTEEVEGITSHSAKTRGIYGMVGIHF